MKQGVITFLSWFFAIVFSAIGLINSFVGNDPEFGIFIVFASLLFYPPIRFAIENKLGWRMPKLGLTVLAIFILWSSLGVGELIDKIQMALSML